AFEEATGWIRGFSALITREEYAEASRTRNQKKRMEPHAARKDRRETTYCWHIGPSGEPERCLRQVRVFLMELLATRPRRFDQKKTQIIPDIGTSERFFKN